jgi:hypothetical protein
VKLAFTKKAKQDLDHIAIQVAAHDIDIAVQLVIDIEHRRASCSIRRRWDGPRRDPVSGSLSSTHTCCPIG